MNKLKQIKEKWLSENLKESLSVDEQELLFFQKQNHIFLPFDLKEYFKILNGTENEYDDNFMQFYSLQQFKKITEAYKDWEGMPNYKNIVNKLPNFEKYYVFANYQCHLLAYAIYIDANILTKNEILVICGNKYKKIANSFTEFINLYIRQSSDLFDI